MESLAREIDRLRDRIAEINAEIEAIQWAIGRLELKIKLTPFSIYDGRRA